PKGQRSGLRDASEILGDVKGVSFIEFSAADVVRHPLVTRIVTAYDQAEANRHAAAPYENNKNKK
ncbi:MAG: PhoH family protein, partial [Rhodospirillaceae bacterium]|nr:PhoH family protein [Rhodospirillaceae bacterium]